MLLTGGRTVVVDEPALVEANALACGTTDIGEVMAFTDDEL